MSQIADLLQIVQEQRICTFISLFGTFFFSIFREMLKLITSLFFHSMGGISAEGSSIRCLAQKS